MTRTTALNPLERGPSTDTPFTNNVDRLTKASAVAQRKRSNSDLSVDGLALLASTTIEAWDHNGQHNHRIKMLELREMSIASQEDQWLEKHNQLKEFYQKHGHAQVASSNCEDVSLVCWVDRQRRCCKSKTESRINLLNAVGFDWTSQEDQWLEKYNQLKEFYQEHGRVPVTSFNRADKSLAHWVETQRRCCKMKSRIKLLNDVEFNWSASEDRWLEKFNRLKEFYNAHGHIKVRRSNAGNSLYLWVHKQCRYCKSENRRKMIESIEFRWDRCS